VSAGELHASADALDGVTARLGELADAAHRLAGEVSGALPDAAGALCLRVSGELAGAADVGAGLADELRREAGRAEELAAGLLAGLGRATAEPAEAAGEAIRRLLGRPAGQAGPDRALRPDPWRAGSVVPTAPAGEWVPIRPGDAPGLPGTEGLPGTDGERAGTDLGVRLPTL
jgi:hypothetical protein